MTQAPEMEKAVADADRELAMIQHDCEATGGLDNIEHSEARTWKAVARQIAAVRNKLRAIPAPSLSLSGQWQPISTAPKDGTLILVCGKSYRGEYYVCDVKWRDDIGGWCLFDPSADDWNCESFEHTHWMPPPAPPPPAIPADEDISETSEGLDDPADRKP